MDHFSFERLNLFHHEPQQRGFADAIRTHDCCPSALVDANVNVVKQQVLFSWWGGCSI